MTMALIQNVEERDWEESSNLRSSSNLQ